MSVKWAKRRGKARSVGVRMPGAYVSTDPLNTVSDPSAVYDTRQFESFYLSI